MDSLESPDYDTVGGFIFSQLHTIPKDGTTFDLKFDSLIFHVTRLKTGGLKRF